MKKIYLFSIFTFLFLISFTSIYTEETEYLKEITTFTKVRFSDIALPLSLEENLVKPGTSQQDAIKILLKTFPKLNKVNQKSYLNYSDISLICMQIYELKGGFFYSLFQNRHYSFRELQYLNIIPDTLDPMKKISGKETYNLLIQTSKLQEL